MTNDERLSYNGMIEAYLSKCDYIRTQNKRIEELGEELRKLRNHTHREDIEDIKEHLSQIIHNP